MSNKENRAKDGSNRNGNGNGNNGNNGNNNGNSYRLEDIIQGNFTHYPDIIQTQPLKENSKRISFWDILFGKV